jgi:hypothetical protein
MIKSEYFFIENFLEPLKFQKESPQTSAELRNQNQTHCRNVLKLKSKSDINDAIFNKENKKTNIAFQKPKERSFSNSGEENFNNQIDLPNFIYEIETSTVAIDEKEKAKNIIKENELLVDANSSKKNQSTNTPKVTTFDKCVQTENIISKDENDVVLFGLSSLNLFEKICSLVETDLLNELLDSCAKAELNRRESLQQGKRIPNSPPRLAEQSIINSTTSATVINKPSQADGLETTILLPCSSNKISSSNRPAYHPPAKMGAESGLGNFSELIEIGYNEMRKKSSTISGNIIIRNKKVPALEFIQPETQQLQDISKNQTEANSILNTSIGMINESKHQKEKEEVNKQTIETEKVTEYIDMNNFPDVVVETPVKNNEFNFVWVTDGDQAELAELNRTLSKSETRMVYADCDESKNHNSRGTDVPQSSHFEESLSTSLIKQDKIDKIESTSKETIPLSAAIETSLVPKLPSLPLVNINKGQQIINTVSLPSNNQRQQNGNERSFMLNSFNIYSNENASAVPTLVLTTKNEDIADNTKLNVKPNAKPIIPAAVDLLGQSVANNDTTLVLADNSDQKASSINETLDPSSGKTPKEAERMQQTLLSKEVIKADDISTSSSATRTIKEEETQLLTDSELFKIDAFCKNMYSSHNQSVNNDGIELKSSIRSRSYSKSSPAPVLIGKKRMEFVYSLLNSEMKAKFYIFYRVF